MKRLAIGIAFLVAMFVVPQFTGGGSGAGVQCVDSKCVAAAFSSVLAIAFGPASFVVLLLLPRHAFKSTDAVVGFWRMVGAWAADIFLVTTGTAALMALPMLIAESQYTGSFAWQFSREVLRPTDWPLASLAAFGTFAIVLALRVNAHVSGRPSFGQYLLGYQVTATADRMNVKSAFVRLGWANLCLALWPAYLPYKFFKRLTKDWWDERCGSSATQFEYTTP